MSERPESVDYDSAYWADRYGEEVAQTIEWLSGRVEHLEKRGTRAGEKELGQRADRLDARIAEARAERDEAKAALLPAKGEAFSLGFDEGGTRATRLAEAMEHLLTHFEPIDTTPAVASFEMAREALAAFRSKANGEGQG